MEHINKNPFARRRRRSWREIRAVPRYAPSEKSGFFEAAFIASALNGRRMETETRCAHKGGAELTKEQQLCPSIRQ